jgi:tryptophan halogenase
MTRTAPFILEASTLGMFGTERARPYVDRVAACVQGVSLQGCERSIKLVPGALNANRFLLGAPVEQWPEGRLHGCAGHLSMPDAFRARLDDALRGANAVLFGFEESRRGCLYKLYFEYWERVRRTAGRDSTRARLMFLGFKWDPDDARRRVVSEYWCAPGIPAGPITGRIESLCEDAPVPLARTAARIIAMTVREGRETPMVYLEVREPGNPRCSFDLNLYRAGLRLSDVAPVVADLCRALDIEPADFERHIESRDCILGHISGGVARDGEPFFTLYYDIDPDA